MIDTLNAKIETLGNLPVPNPEHGDMKLNVYPIEWSGGTIWLPEQFAQWDLVVESMLSRVPLCNGANQHYITIDSQFFTTGHTQRREGIHIDGNFCADPDFCNNGMRSAWGGGTSTWGGTKVTPELIVSTPWVSPYGIIPPLGIYVSSELGGILTAASYAACEAYQGHFEGELLSEGDCSMINLSDTTAQLLEANKLHFMSSDTPHESIPVPKGTRRTFIRVTLNHNYPNRLLFS